MSRSDLAGRVAIVTGGARGLGLAIAQRLSVGGARVALWDTDAAVLAMAAAKLDFFSSRTNSGWPSGRSRRKR